MSINFNKSFSQKIKFIKHKNKHEDEHNLQIIDSCETTSEDKYSTRENQSTTHLSRCLKPARFLVFIILSFIVVTCVYLYNTTVDSQSISSNKNKDTNILVCRQFNASISSHCFPLETVEKVIITISNTSNYSCTDNVTCSSLLKRIEEEQDGLKYNFVIGSDSELYIGLGFKCRVDCTESALRIKILTDDQLTLHSKPVQFRIFDILKQGIDCGKIFTNYTVFETFPNGTISRQHLFEGFPDISIPDSVWENPYSFYEPDYETGTLVHKDFKWFACGETPKEAKRVKSKVITLENLPNCSPFKPVDHISIDVVNSTSITCSNTSCSDMSHIIEEQHNGLKYNFIIGTHADLYIGLGFKCNAANIDNTLNIKILVQSSIERIHYFRLAEIIEQGKSCGKILGNYSITTDCDFHVQCHFFETVSTFKYLLDKLVEGFNRKINYYDNKHSGGLVVRSHFKWIFCNKSDDLDKLSTQSSSEHTQELTNIYETTSTSHPDETTNNHLDETTNSYPDETSSSQVNETTSSHLYETTSSHLYEPTHSQPDETTNAHSDETKISHPDEITTELYLSNSYSVDYNYEYYE